MAAKKKTTKKKATKKVNNDKKIEKKIEMKCKKKFASSCDNCGGMSYFLGFLGALIYYISTSTGFWGVVLGVLKAIVWPVFIVHGLLKFLGL